MPIALYAPLALGAVRRTRTGLNREVFAALKAEKRGSPAFHRFLESLGPSSPPEEIRMHVNCVNLVTSARLGTDVW